MPNIDLSILNQRQTPAFYADVFANRPAAGFVGRIFISTNTFAFYRDNGTSWDLIGGPGTGTVTGTGANGQVTFWNGASTITGSNDLFWDATNGHLGVNTNAPGTALDVHHDQPTVAILNQTVATNDTRIGFQNNGVGLWRIGAFYNAGANDFGIYDAVAAIQPVTVKKTTGQVLIGTSTVGSGKLVVASATGDNGIQIVGATAPSLRIDSAESGPTKRAGLGISTATNNFIQGSADRDFCIFNGSTAAASPILFGIYDAAAVNVQEAARISAARNFLIGTTTDGGQKLQVNGGARATGYYLDNMTAGSGALYYNLAQNRVTLANYNVSGILDFEVNGGDSALTLNSDKSSSFRNFIRSFNSNGIITLANGNTSSGTKIQSFNAAGDANGYLSFEGFTKEYGRFDANGNFLIGTSVPGDQTGLNDLLTIGLAGSTSTGINFTNGTATRWGFIYINNTKTVYGSLNNTTFEVGASATEAARFVGTTSNLLIGTTTDNGKKLQLSGSFIQNGNNTNYQANTQTFANGGTVTFGRNNDGYGGNLGDNIGGQIIVSISEPNSNVDSNTAIYVGTVNKPRGADATVTQISKTLGGGITAFTVTNSGSDISVTATSSTASTLRVTLTFIGGGGLS